MSGRRPFSRNAPSNNRTARFFSSSAIRDRAAEILCTLGLDVAALGPLFGLAPFHTGHWLQVEPATAAAHFGAALCGLGAACSLTGPKAGFRARRLIDPAVLLPAVVGVLGLVFLPFAANPGASLLGHPNLGIGAMWWVSAACFAAGVKLTPRSRLSDHTAMLFLLSGLGVALWCAAVPFNPRINPYMRSELGAFSALLGPAAWLSLKRSGLSKVGLRALLVGAAVVLLIGHNRSAAVVFLPAALFTLLRRERGLAASGRGLVFVATALLPLVCTAVLGLLPHAIFDDAKPLRSLRMRTGVADIAECAVRNAPQTLVVGAGFGVFPDLAATCGRAVRIASPVLDDQKSERLLFAGWEGFLEPYYDFFNFWLETGFGTGVLGLAAALCWIGWAPARSSPGRRGSLWPFALAFGAVASTWFVPPSVLGMLAVALSGASRPFVRGPLKSGLIGPVATKLVATTLVAAALAVGTAGVKTLSDARLADRERDFIAAVHEADRPAKVQPFGEYDRSGLVLASLLRDAALDAYANPDAGAPALLVRLFAAEERVAKGAVSTSLLANRLFAFDVLFLPLAKKAPWLSEARRAFYPSWIAAGEALIKAAPDRADLLAPLFTRLYQDCKDAELLRLLDMIEQRTPNEPTLGWWRGKLAFAANPEEARRLMRRSLSAGLTKAVLIGPAMEAALTDDSDGSLARFSATLLRIGLVRRP